MGKGANTVNNTPPGIVYAHYRSPNYPPGYLRRIP